MNVAAQLPRADWPLSQYSRMIRCGGLHWHVQMLGQGPTIVLIHGTGASTHSWRDVAVQLSDEFKVVMFDLPGHGFTTGASRRQMSLTGMSRVVGALINQISEHTHFVIGHSAGAAIACQMVLDNRLQVERLVSINGALKPFDGMAGQLFSPLAKALSGNSLIPRLVSWRAAASDRLTTRLLEDTGSTLDSEAIGYYSRLMQREGHVAGALGMMAQWDLKPLWQRLPALDTPMLFIVGSQDRTVLPRQSSEASRRIPNGTFECLSGLGHLCHEENPTCISDALMHYFHQYSDGLPPGTRCPVDGVNT